MADGSNYVDLLRDIALFANLPADELTHIAERCRWIDRAAQYGAF